MKHIVVQFSHCINTKGNTMNRQDNPILLKAKNNMIDNIKNSNIPLPQLANMIGVSVSVLQNFVNGKHP